MATQDYLQKSSDGTAVSHLNDSMAYQDVTNSRIGIGTTLPAERLHVVGGSLKVSSTYAIRVTDNNVEFNRDNGPSYIVLNTANQWSLLFMTGPSGSGACRMGVNDYGVKVSRSLSSGPMSTEGLLYAHQENSTAAIPVLQLKQDDTDEPFIHFAGGTVYTGKTGADEYVKVKVGSNTRYMKLYS